MKTAKMLTILVVALGLILCQPKVSEAAPMGTAFTYQGRLIDANETVDGLYDFAFRLYNANVGGSKAANDVNVADVETIDGYFTVLLDFNEPNAFNGDARWLEIGVRPGELEDSNVYTTLSPRQEVTPAPYAIYAQSSGSDNDWMVSGSDIYSIPSGNVGIGTTNPLSKLSVGGDGLANTSVYGEHSSGNYGELGTLNYGVYGRNSSSGNEGWVGTSSHGVYGLSWSGTGYGVYGLHFNSSNYGYLGTSGEGVFGFSPSSYGVYGESESGTAAYFTSTSGYGLIVENGSVGIGTTSPAYDLDVNGDIRAIGSVYYGGTIGNADGTAYNKPDYVFEEGYYVMSTEQVEEYLKKENHLPWITSAEQEKEENDDVIDMTRMAFETVETAENLQIQVIELNKRNKALEKRVARLEKMVLGQQFVSAKEVYNENH